MPHGKRIAKKSMFPEKVNFVPYMSCLDLRLSYIRRSRYRFKNTFASIVVYQRYIYSIVFVGYICYILDYFVLISSNAFFRRKTNDVSEIIYRCRDRPTTGARQYHLKTCSEKKKNEQKRNKKNPAKLDFKFQHNIWASFFFK